jgi:hypothetical protein
MLAWKAKSSDPNVASVRYRCLIPLEALKARGFPVSLFEAGQADRYEGVIFSKSYGAADQELARRLKARGARVALDLCDNHFYNPHGLPAYQQAGKDLLAMISLADLVVCSTDALADMVAAAAGLTQRPQVVGDPVDVSAQPSAARAWWKHFLPRRAPPAGRTLLWFGIYGSPNAPCGIADITRIAGPLAEASRRHPFELVVCSNSEKEYAAHIKPLPFVSRYVDYDRSSFSALLSGADGVVLPINPNPFTAAKSHNRLTTALYAGVPAAADGIASYREFAPFCTLDDWPRGLEEMLAAPAAAKQKALAGKKYIEERWTPARVAERWEEILSPLCAGRAAEPLKEPRLS